MHARNEATLKLRALLSGTQLAARVDFSPRGAGLRQRLDFGAVAGFGDLFPFPDDAEIGDFLEPVENRLLLRVVDFLAAGVVAASLHVTGTQRPQMFFKERNVLKEQ